MPRGVLTTGAMPESERGSDSALRNPTNNGIMNKYECCVKPRFALIREVLLEGGGLSEAARRLGVSATSLRRYRGEHPELAELFRECAEAADDRVEAALLRRATGYEVDDGRPRHIPPDVKAAVFWLKNRRPKRWRERGADAAGTLKIQLATEEEKL